MRSPFCSLKFKSCLCKSAISSYLAFIASSAASLRSFSWSISALVLLLLAVILHRLAPVPFKAKNQWWKLVNDLCNNEIENTYYWQRLSCWMPDICRGPSQRKDSWSLPSSGFYSWLAPWPSLWREHQWQWLPRWLSIALAGERSLYGHEGSSQSTLGDCWGILRFFRSWECCTEAHR